MPLDDDHAVHPQEITLLDYVVGDLGADTSDLIRRHVETCQTCRDRIVELTLDLDELDRLPLLPIPHDLLGAPAAAARAPRRRAHAGRIVPLLLLAVAALGVIALFQLGGMRPDDGAPARRQLVLQLGATSPSDTISSVLADVPHTVVTDRDDPRHLVVLVGDGDIGRAYSLLASASDGTTNYVVDLGATGQLPADEG